MLTSTGSGTLTISSIITSGDFSQKNNCGTSVAAGENCTVSVVFTPTETGTKSGTLSIADDASGSPVTVTLNGTGVAVAVASLPGNQDAPLISLSPTSLTFASRAVGSTSTAQTVTLTNSGNAALSVTSLAFTGTNAGDFAETHTCGSSVAAGGNCTVSVTFTPAASGARTATLRIADNASGSPQTVSLTGTGASTALVASVSPTSLAFGNQSVGARSAAQTVTLTNSGNAALSVTSLNFTGTNASDFAQTNTCGSSVAAGSNCTISVTFTPAANGSRTATLSIADNASGSPQTLSLTGTGANTAPVASVSPTSLAFGNQPVGAKSAPQTVTLTNSGNAALSVTSLTFTGTNASDFAQTNTCGSSVAAGGKCTISVTFTPAASGSRTATLSIADNAGGSPQTLSLTGTGASAALGASVSPTTLAFGNQSVGAKSAAQTVTLTNSGSAALSVTSLNFTGTNASDFAQTNTCGSSVAAGGKCTISVTFTPAASGSRTATLSIADNASGSPQTVSLTGTGASTAPVASVSPTTLTFVSQAIKTTSAAQTVTLTNSGAAALGVSSITFTGTDPSDFVETNTCGSSVAAGANCTIAVLFTPSASGALTAALSIADNATGSPQTVSLSGTGSHDVVLSWTASATAGVTGYYIYRGTASGGEQFHRTEFHVA